MGATTGIFRGSIAAAMLLMAAAGLVRAESPGRAQIEHPPHRVITLSPHATEMIYAAGAGDTLIATVSSSDFPQEVCNLSWVGDGILLNQERILMLQPTLLVGWLRSSAAMQIERVVDKLGARVVYSRPLQLRDIPAEVRRLGSMLGSGDNAAAAADT